MVNIRRVPLEGQINYRAKCSLVAEALDGALALLAASLRVRVLYANLGGDLVEYYLVWNPLGWGDLAWQVDLLEHLRHGSGDGGGDSLRDQVLYCCLNR